MIRKQNTGRIQDTGYRIQSVDKKKQNTGMVRKQNTGRTQDTEIRIQEGYLRKQFVLTFALSVLFPSYLDTSRIRTEQE